MTATYLTTPEQLASGRIEVEGDAYRHLFRARRLAVGDTLRVVDGEGRTRSAVVAEVERSRARLTVGGELPSLEPKRRVHLLVAALRPERAGWLVEKATELGAVAITFFSSERTPRSYGQAKLDRWRRLAVSAVEQSGRARLPTIDGVVPLDAALEAAAGSAAFSLEPGAPRLADGPFAEGGDVALVVGPEGGFGPADLAALRRAGVEPRGLGASILRVETAAVAALAIALLV